VSRSSLTLALAVTLAACTSACSALLDWSFTGGLGDAGAGDGGETDASSSDATTDVTADVTSDGSEASPSPDVLVPCGSGGTCASNAPPGWMGPVSLYVGAGAPPACDADASSLFDGKGDLVAPAASCTSCGCGGATGVSCAPPVVTGFDAPGCSSGGTTQTISSSCTPILAAAVTVAVPQPTGSCTPSGGVATTTPPAWMTQARACPVSPSGTCSGGALCVPAQPASNAVCVMQPGAATACPAGYPSGPQIFYTGVDDARGCTTCTCGAVSGVTCTIASPAVGAFDSPTCTTTPTVSLSAPSACTSLGTSLFVELVATPVLSGQGSCTTSGGGAPTGTATGTGAASFCCLL
jgi:hypothetical protein